MAILVKNPIAMLLMLQSGPLYGNNREKLTLCNESTTIHVSRNDKVFACYCNLVSIKNNLCGKEYSREKPIPDKTLVLCWDTDWGYRRDLRFYDAKNNSTFSSNGERNGTKYSNYKAIPTNNSGEYEGEFAWANNLKHSLLED